jgi:hypothetical protein
MKKIYFLVFLGLTCFVSPVKSQTNPADKWIADTFFVDSLFVEYRLFVPENYDSTVNYPLIVVYGGVSDNTEPYFAHFDLAGTWISFADSVNQKNNPCFILVPGLPQSGEWWWEPAVDIPVNALFASLLKEYSIDQNRVYLTGFSLGGLQSYIALEYATDLIAAAIPICGNYGEANKVKIFKDVPNWTFHGQDDGTVKVKNSRVVMEEYEKLNSKVIYTNSKYRQEINLSDDQIKNHILAHSNPFYTEYLKVGHESWTQAYETPLLQDWLFSKYKLKAGAIRLTNLNNSKVYPTLNESFTIKWNSSNPKDSVEIWFSNNNGESWELIQSQINTRSYVWDVSKVQDCSLGKIRLLLKNSLGFVYGINESSLFAIDNNASNGAPLVKILNQEFVIDSIVQLNSINLQMLIADPEKDSVTVILFVSCDKGLSYHNLDTFKVSTQIDTVLRLVNLKDLGKVEEMVLKAEISDNVSTTIGTTLYFNNYRGTPGACITSVESNIENSDIQIYPNPFDDELLIQTSGNREYSVELITITGNTIYQSKTEGNFHRINLRELSSGIYFVRMKSDNIVSVRKVIKQ